MCGIIGVVGHERVASLLLEGIKRLEYRGYDSVGMAVVTSDGIQIKKDIGTVDEVHEKVQFNDLDGKRGISHSRWATHGGVTKLNAHPHLSCDGKLSIVHNGIIENYEVLRKQLQEQGHTFVSDTDSEVVAHYFEEKLKTGDIHAVSKSFLNDFRGTFAVLVLRSESDDIVALRRDSPLVIGLCEGKNILASDIYAFSNLTDKAIFFDDDEYAIVSKNDYVFYDKNGLKIEKQVQEFTWDQEESTQNEYAHYMLKEIMEEPAVVKRLLVSLKTEQKEVFGKLVGLVRDSHKIVFVGAGSSYHATLLGAYYLHKCGVEAQTLIASEFEHFAWLDKDALVIACSQSGETMDVIDALKYAQSKGAKIASIVNVPYSTIQRMSDVNLNIFAGQEVCVASTKSFINQVVMLLSIVKEFGFEIDLETLPDQIRAVFEKEEKLQEIAHSIADKRDMYVLGRGLSYPVAREMALKIKEISYIHAEGMMGGELKHGTIALIEDGTPVISLVSNNDVSMITNTKEVESRGARIIMIGTEQGDIILPTKHDGAFGILASVAGQLLTYYIALKKGLPIDKPRNLAKSVTVR